MFPSRIYQLEGAEPECQLGTAFCRPLSMKVPSNS